MASALLPPLLALLLFSAGAVCAAGTAPTATAAPTTIRAQRGKPNTSPPAPLVRALVQSTCNATAYYDLCVAVLVADPSSATADLGGLCAIALSAAAANASATQAALANTSSSSSSSGGRVQHALFRACAGKYGEAREALLEARESVGEEAYDDAFVQVSAAAEYPAVCRTLFRRRRAVAYPYPAELATREEALQRLCTVAIDIITLLYSS